MATGFRDIKLGNTTAELVDRDDGSQLLRIREPLGDYPDTLMERLDHWAATKPDALFVAERDGQGEWRRFSYSQARGQVRSLAQALLDRNVSVERPLVILSGNSIEHLMLAMAAMYVGIPYAPISPAYCRVSKDFGKAKYISELLTPGLFLSTQRRTTLMPLK